MQAWYPGQKGGTAFSDLLYGEFNPSGRLPLTFYADDSQVKDFKDYDMEGRTYRYFRGTPLYAFGHGLSYTTFAFSKPIVKVKGDAVALTFTLKNTGRVDGTETAQVYFRRTADKEGPMKTLCGYQQVSLKAGQTRTVTITLPKKQLESWDAQTNTMRFVPGQYQLMVGSSSADNALLKINTKL